MPYRWASGWVVVVLCLVAGPQVGGTVAQASAPRATTSLTGAGSTFIAPLMNAQWTYNYTTAQVTYTPIGSGAGISAWTAQTVDFAASDALLTAAQERLAAASCGASTGATVAIPATIGAVALIYNVPGVRSGLRLSPTVISAIFQGRIVSWNDAAIAAINPGVRLPSLPIQVVYRSDGSGTTYIVTNYLSAVSPTWQHAVGAAARVAWPIGSGAKGSAGMVQQVSITLGAIGYVDLAYARQDNLDYAQVQNARGGYIAPAVAAATRAAASFAPRMPANLQQIIVNAAADGAYPITGYSYILLCGRQHGARGRALIDFVRYAVSAGQSGVETLYYAPLPTTVQRLDLEALNRISVS